MNGWTISVAELRETLSSAGAAAKPVLIDVREPEEHAEVRIEDAILIPLGTLQGLASLEVPKDAEIVVFCAHGVRSMQGALKLLMLGYKRVKSLEGGICEWEESGGPVSRK